MITMAARKNAITNGIWRQRDMATALGQVKQPHASLSTLRIGFGDITKPSAEALLVTLVIRRPVQHLLRGALGQYAPITQHHHLLTQLPSHTQTVHSDQHGGTGPGMPTLDRLEHVLEMGEVQRHRQVVGVGVWLGRFVPVAGSSVALYQPAADSTMTSFQIANRVDISCRYCSAVSRWRRGRKCGDMAPNANKNRWALPGEGKCFMARSR